MTNMKFERTLAVDADGDFLRDEQGKLGFYDGVRGVKQELKILLSTVKGEQPFAPDFGLDVFEIAGAPPAIIEREVRLVLRNDDRVQTVNGIDIERSEADDDRRTVNVTVNLTLVDATNVTLDGVTI